jgi:hypothetical protein
MLFTRRVCTNTIGDKPPAKEKKGKEAPRTGTWSNFFYILAKQVIWKWLYMTGAACLS